MANRRAGSESQHSTADDLDITITDHAFLSALAGDVAGAVLALIAVSLIEGSEGASGGDPA